MKKKKKNLTSLLLWRDLQHNIVYFFNVRDRRACGGRETGMC